MANRLANALSPYLLQHQNNPVDWYPWGEAAFAEAKARDCPILLSIGYSACHWCHVMERESFESPSIARQMNEGFVSVKVDREERPDLDQVYQAVVQRMGRSGGWPLTVFLTPERKPFFAGTYFPPVPKFGMPSFPELLGAVSESWRGRRNELEDAAAELTRDVSQIVEAAKSDEGALPSNMVGRAAERLLSRVDAVNGGFGDRPKFPSTMALEVLLRAGAAGSSPALAAASRALDAMQDGGIHDQLGGGFHRYSTDARWLVPHFEKMLDQNGLLLRLYAEGFRALPSPSYEATMRGLFSWLERDMSDASGRFFASSDADSRAPGSAEGSEAREGLYFVWTRAEIEAVLDPGDAEIFALAYGAPPEGNFAEGPKESSVLHRASSVPALAEKLGKSEADVTAALARGKERLLLARSARPRPFTDEKLLTSWNALTISGLAEASMALSDPALLSRAVRALTAYEAELAAGLPLVRATLGGARSSYAFLDDYADLAAAALDVHEASSDDRWLTLAGRLAEDALALFWDEQRGVMELAPREATDLIARPSDVVDHATPSGAATMAIVLLRLAPRRPADEERFTRIAERIALPHADIAARHPAGLAQLTLALDWLEHGPTEIVVLGERDDPRTLALLEVARVRYVPRRVLTWLAPESSSALPARYGVSSGATTAPRAFVCRGRVCELPVSDAAALSTLLGAKERAP